VAGKAGPAARLAALELQYHAMRIAGVELPIRSDNEMITGPRVLIGESTATRGLGFKGADFAPQEYLIALRPQTLILIGRDWENTDANRREPGRTTTDETLASLRHKIDYWKTVGRPERSVGEMELPGLYDDQGTCYAVYDFLERFCGVRWYGPTDLNIEVPSQKSLVVRGADVRRSPVLKHRSAMSQGSWPYLRGQWGTFTPSEVYLYWRRLRLGGEKWAGNHTIHRRTVKELFKDPEYQAQGPGRGMHLCYTNPKLVGVVAQMARDFFDRKGEVPDGFKAMGDYFAVVPEDTRQFCQCPRCRTLLRTGKDMTTGQFSSGEVSDYWFSFVNAVAREVHKTHPDKYIATLAYWCYAFPPKGFDVESNVSVAPCLHLCYYAIGDKVRENDMKLYRQWLSKTRAAMFMWVYYHHPMEPALINKWKCFPNIMVHETARGMRMFIKDGVRGMFECGEQDQLEQYVMAKLWDDPDQDLDAMIDEFFRSYFGAAGKPMKTFYLKLEEIACNKANYPKGRDCQTQAIAWEKLGTAERMEELRTLIQDAKSRAETDRHKRRVSLWHDAIWKWMADGRAEYLARPHGK
jgi:hypothetical protein